MARGEAPADVADRRFGGRELDLASNQIAETTVQPNPQ
jgi:hypothetical protein